VASARGALRAGRSHSGGEIVGSVSPISPHTDQRTSGSGWLPRAYGHSTAAQPFRGPLLHGLVRGGHLQAGLDACRHFGGHV
jgi:hypothetical protein